MNNRALILAGGGMRVAWQAGVVKALDEAGVADFSHVDGTSGGIFNTAALLSGISPTELVEKWSTLDVHDFVSFLPIHEYLQSPTNLRAAGDADRIIEKVLPHLGISIDAIHSSPKMSGTFNVANFTSKTAVAIPHDEIDLDRLVAGVSLPIFLPPVEAHGDIWTDAVWMRDANPLEAIRRGCDELWLLWCIGNTTRWGNGALEQYVHMIELSANSALFEDLERIPTPFRLHVIKPQYPLPLDPDYYMGRITSDLLVDMGYRDAWNYLVSFNEEGVVPDYTCTQMTDPPLGVRLRTQYEVLIDGDERLEVVLGTEIHDLDRFTVDRAHSADLVGHVMHPTVGRLLLRHGTFHIEDLNSSGGTRLISRAVTGPADSPWFVELEGEWRDDPGFDLWGDVTTAQFTIRTASHEGPVLHKGVAKLGIAGLRRAIASIEPTGAHDLSDRAGIIAKAAHFLFGRAHDH